MAFAQPPSPDTTSGTKAESVPTLENQAEGGCLVHKALANRRVEIEEDEKLKLHLKVWEDDKKEELLRVESYRGRCTAAMTELYQLMGFYSLFQGVVFSAVSNRKLSCPTAISPFLLSLLTSIATAVSIHYKLTFYKTEKLKFIRAEWDVNNLIKKINKLKGQGKDFKFEEIEDPYSDPKRKAKTLKLADDARKIHKLFYRAAMSFLVVFSCIILISCYVVLYEIKSMPCYLHLGWSGRFCVAWHKFDTQFGVSFGVLEMKCPSIIPLPITRGWRNYFSRFYRNDALSLLKSCTIASCKIEIGGDSSLFECKGIAQAYVTNVLVSLQERYSDLRIFNVAKLFNPSSPKG